MSRRTFAGQIDAAGLALLAGHVTDDEYRRRADLNRPHRTQIRCEALRLWHSGLTARDIAVALQLSESMVQAWIAEASA